MGLRPKQTIDVRSAVEQNLGSVQIDDAPDGAGDEVPLVTIDGLSLSACALLKIDAEGMDYDVLLGAADTIARTRPVLYFEGHAGDATTRAIAFARSEVSLPLARRGVLRGRQLSPGAERFASKGGVNVLAIPEEHALAVTLPPVSAPDADWKRDYASFLMAQRDAHPPR